MNLAFPAPGVPSASGAPNAKVTPPVTKFTPALQAARSPHAFATGMFLFYAFVLMSRAVEFLPGVLGINPRLMVVLLPLCLIAAFVAGNFGASFKSPVVLMLSALTVWFLIASLSSQWRGGSARVMAFIWSISYVTALLVPSLISTLAQCRKMFYTLAFALLPILAATFFFQTDVQGRVAGAFGSLGNPNDLAFALMLLMPFAVYVVQTESVLSWKGALCVLTLGLALLRILRTGSRSGLLTLLLCFLIVLAVGTVKTKMKMVAVGFLVAVLALATVSNAVILRYATVFNGTAVNSAMSEDEVSAIESTRARKMLLEESVRLMFEHPLFGVGPGIFSAALADEQKEQGHTQTWHEAHNSFTQMGSEAGLPALALYLSVLLYCMKRSASIYFSVRRDPRQIATARMAAALFVSLFVFAICAAFGNYAYSFHLPLLSALVQAFDIAVRKNALVRAAAPAAPTVPPKRPAGLPAVAPQIAPQFNRPVAHARFGRPVVRR